MKILITVFLVLSMLLAACGGEELIGEERAIDIAFTQVGNYTSASVRRDSAICTFVPIEGGYKVAFGDLIFLVDCYTGKILEVMQSA